jgi:hypothetical protein
MNLSYEQIRGQIAGLPLLEQKRLLEELKGRLGFGSTETVTENGAAGGDFVWPDPAPNDAWLKQHAQEFQGQWVVLYNGELLGHGNDSKSLAAAARESGAPVPLILFLPPETQAEVMPFIGWL